MNSTRSLEEGPDRDLVSVGAGLAVLAGGLSVAIPFLTGLTLAVACIVFALWLTGSRSRPVDPSAAPRNPPTRTWFWISVTLFVGSLILFFGSPPSIASFRGLVLAAPPTACWWSSTPRTGRSRSA